VKASEIVPAFLAACPGLGAPWDEHLAFWDGETDRGDYNDVAVVAEYLVDRYEAGNLSEFPAAFAVLERCLAEGDDETIEVTTIGIVEGIQTIASHRPFDAEAFERWLKPRSRLAWLVGVAAWGCQFTLAGWLREQLRSEGQRFVQPDPKLIQSAGMQEIVERLYPK
jgi:hypothetical protein